MRCIGKVNLPASIKAQQSWAFDSFADSAFFALESSHQEIFLSRTLSSTRRTLFSLGSSAHEWAATQLHPSFDPLYVIPDSVLGG